MSRRTLREQLFKLLFRIEFNSIEEMQEQCGLFFEDIDNPITEEESAIIKERFDGVMERLEEIDKNINEKAKGWSTERMGKVDLTIIRLAVFEILYDESVPNGVAINEAVEIAKKFGQDESYSFVNGILARFV